jgi:hypothetical protein
MGDMARHAGPHGGHGTQSPLSVKRFTGNAPCSPSQSVAVSAGPAARYDAGTSIKPRQPDKSSASRPVPSWPAQQAAPDKPPLAAGENLATGSRFRQSLRVNRPSLRRSVRQSPAPALPPLYKDPPPPHQTPPLQGCAPEDALHTPHPWNRRDMQG